MKTKNPKAAPKQHWSEGLKKLNACSEAVEWARVQRSAATAWKKCERGDWMLWLLGRQAGPPGSESRKPLVLATCDCAGLAKSYWSAGDDRPAKALTTARSWARGEGATIEDVRAAACTSYTSYAAYAAAAYADAAAYGAAAYAAYAAAAYAAAAYAAAAAYGAAADARSSVLSKCADIVRGHYPMAPKVSP